LQKLFTGIKVLPTYFVRQQSETAKRQTLPAPVHRFLPTEVWLNGYIIGCVAKIFWTQNVR
jgi:hypothetical protein